jgi:hypothetical protein
VLYRAVSQLNPATGTFGMHGAYAAEDGDVVS